MGNWHISIDGIGLHHNQDYPNDANKLAKEFVDKLKEVGHIVISARFTHGGAEQLDDKTS